MSNDKPVRVWLVEDNERFRRTLRRSMETLAGIDCSADFPSLEAAFAQLEQPAKPDVILLDIGLPGVSGIAGLPKLKQLAPAAKVVILTVFDDHERVFQAVCAGADGYLLKTSSINRVEEAVREVAAGGASMNPDIARKVLDALTNQRKKPADEELSEREQEVLRLVVEGLTKKGIAGKLDLSTHTVDSHLRNIYQKLHVNNRSAAVAAAMRDGLV
ncbi:response regulator [Anatilimnocola floriformis]|uniref:response regulator n=1 Tax=Anatilimnocola floriformis TaxID=2948575 RepID=UPI0020C38799|nr:response regulator transcription factor [Anatilimnocola floriformis]